TILLIPTSYFLTVEFGLIGPAAANLLSFSVYNFVRYWFLWKKFALQPFSKKTAEIIVLSILSYGIIYLIFLPVGGLVGLIGRTAAFMLLFIACLYYRNISPDLKPVVNSLMKRFRSTRSI
ncbi:MAG: lipopolysaccharide biosynthesis protein, partial [Sphingobacteriales bacterium]